MIKNLEKGADITSSMLAGYEFSVEVWETIEEECSSITVFPSTHTDEQKKSILGAGEHKLLRTIVGNDWNDCMTKHHKIMGWEPYIPF